MKTVSYTRMEDGTAEDYAFEWSHADAMKLNLVPGVLELVERLKEVNPGLQVSRYEHSLQTATRAHEDGADEELVVAALLHDIGDTIAPDNHSALAASVLQPYVSERAHWVVLHHGLFQSYYYVHHLGRDRNARDRYRDNPYYQDCVDFCAKYDQNSFDPAYQSRPLEFFEPMVRRVFGREPFSGAKAPSADVPDSVATLVAS